MSTRPAGRMNSTPTPEQRVIIDAVWRAFGFESSSQILEPVDWEVVLGLASRQGLAPLVHGGLASGPSSAPDSVLSRLRAAYLGAVVRTEVWVEPTLRRVLAALAERGLEPIVLKGAALAYHAYSDPAYRTLADIDLLVPSEHLGRAGEALVRGGFHIDEAHPEATHHARPYYADDGQVAVELHDRLLPDPNPYAISLELLRDRSEIYQIGTVEARALALPDALLHTCVHLSYAHRYRWFPFRTLTDVFAITTADQRLDWDRFLETVNCSRTAGAVYWPLEFSRAWLGAPVPEIVLAALAPPAAVRRLVGAVVQPQFLLSNESHLDRGTSALYRMVLDFSLHQASSPGEQLAAYLGDPGRVARAMRSYLGDPALIARLAIAAGRLVAERGAAVNPGPASPG